MIRAIAWFSADVYGCLTEAAGWEKRSPGTAAEMLEVIGLAVKNFGRLPVSARGVLCAAAVARRAACFAAGAEIALLSAGFEPTVAANRAYFQDYVETGRTLGRGNLFIYTLPTSIGGEVAIALSLRGPGMYMDSPGGAMEMLVATARRMLVDGEAEGAMLSWSDGEASVCVAMDAGVGESSLSGLMGEVGGTPSLWMGKLRARVAS